MALADYAGFCDPPPPETGSGVVDIGGSDGEGCMVMQEVPRPVDPTCHKVEANAISHNAEAGTNSYNAPTISACGKGQEWQQSGNAAINAISACEKAQGEQWQPTGMLREAAREFDPLTASQVLAMAISTCSKGKKQPQQAGHTLESHVEGTPSATVWRPLSEEERTPTALVLQSVPAEAGKA